MSQMQRRSQKTLCEALHEKTTKRMNRLLNFRTSASAGTEKNVASFIGTVNKQYQQPKWLHCR
jgi:hypothetical protein